MASLPHRSLFSTANSPVASLANTHPSCSGGRPVVGKSQIMRSASARHRRARPLIDIRLSQMEPTDLRGIPSARATT